jgi:hypothetical protein
MHTSDIDMRFHWIRDRVRQQQFQVKTAGITNIADFFAKPLPVHQHQHIMPLLVRTPT